MAWSHRELSRLLHITGLPLDVASLMPELPPGLLGSGNADGQVSLGAGDPCGTVVAAHVHVFGDRSPEHEQIERYQEGAQADEEREEPSCPPGSPGRSLAATDGDWTRSGLLSGRIIG